MKESPAGPTSNQKNVVLNAGSSMESSGAGIQLKSGASAAEQKRAAATRKKKIYRERTRAAEVLQEEEAKEVAQKENAARRKRDSRRRKKDEEVARHEEVAPEDNAALSRQTSKAFRAKNKERRVVEATASPAGREAEAARRAAEARRIREYRERSKTGDTELLTKEAFSQAAACEHPVTICSVDDAVAACAAISVEPCTWQEFHEFYRSTRRWLLLERRKASVGATNVAGVEKLCAGVMKLVEHAVPVGGVESALCTMLRESRVRPPGRTRDKLLDLLADIVRSYEHALNIVVCTFIPTLLDVFNDINTKETRGQARPILRMLSCLVRTAGDLEHGSMGDLVKAVVHCLKHEEGRYGDSSTLEIQWNCVRFLISVCHPEALTGAYTSN